MAIFRLQENVPDVYPRKSRDFQLMCNAFDIVNSAVKYDIDSITNIANTRLCKDNVLPLLQTKLGFFTKQSMTTEELRAVLQAFRYVVKDKGSRKGIQAAIEVFLKIANASNKSRITILDNYQYEQYVNEDIRGNTYIVEIAIEGRQVDTTLLTELLKYVLPAGHQLKYSFYRAMTPVSHIKSSDTVQIIFMDTSDSRAVRVTTPNDSTSRYPYELTFTADTYYSKNGEQFVLLTEMPVNWPNGEYYICTNTSDNYIAHGQSSEIKPVYADNLYYKNNGGNYTLFESAAEFESANQWYTKETLNEYSKVCLPLNSINGVSTTLTKVYRTIEEFPTTNDYDESTYPIKKSVNGEAIEVLTSEETDNV